MENRESFGARMARVKRERGESGGGPGRTPIADKYRRQTQAVERVFATRAPDVAIAYVDELYAKEPEQCPDHHKVLRCTECDYRSQRTFFDHKAAAYAIDRLLGKPTARSENTLTLRLVQEVTAAVVVAFHDVNDLPDAASRRTAFAERLTELATQYGGAAA